MREPELVRRIVSTMVSDLEVPVTVKMRVFEGDDWQKTIDFAKMVEDAGASLLTVHGRTLKQNKNFCGASNGDIIADINRELAIPVCANGGVETTLDALRLMDHTGCPAVMSSEALLENPALFAPNAVAAAASLPVAPPEGEAAVNDAVWPLAHTIGNGNALAKLTLASRQLAFAREYLELAKRFPPRDEIATIKSHTFKFLYILLEVHHDVRDQLVRVTSNADVVAVLDELCRRYHLPTSTEGSLEDLLAGPVALAELGHIGTSPEDEGDSAPDWCAVAPRSWYRRHRGGYYDQHNQKTGAL